MIRKTLKLATVLGALAGAFSFGYITGVNDEASLAPDQQHA